MQSTITKLNFHLLPTERQHCGKQLPWSIPLNQIHNLNLRCQKERFCAFLSYLFCSVYCYVSFNIFWCCSLFVFVYDLVFFLLFFAGPHTSHTVSLRCLKWALWCGWDPPRVLKRAHRGFLVSCNTLYSSLVRKVCTYKIIDLWFVFLFFHITCDFHLQGVFLTVPPNFQC